MSPSREEILSCIDYTLIKPDATYDYVKKFCNDAITHSFFGVAILPIYLPIAKQELKGSNVKIISFVSYPMGNNPIELKSHTAKLLLKEGVDEIDMVINTSALFSEEIEKVKSEIEEINRIIHREQKLLKIIIELPIIGYENANKVCEIINRAQADYVSTSAGFKSFKPLGWRPVSVQHIQFLKKSLDSNIKVKASGGIRTHKQLMALIKAGASRIGTCSASIIRRVK